jgi:DNA-binding NarL/FixJ family response regulator
VAKLRIVLADDNRTIIAGVRELLDERFEVVDTVEDGQQAIDAVRMLNPDVLLMDISMPVMDGLEAARCLHRLNCRTRIVFLTIHEDPDFVAAALAAGASGYVTKARLRRDLVRAIDETMQGRTFVSNL